MPPTAGEAAAAAARREASRIQDTSSMILAWFRLACPAVLENAGHRTRRTIETRPVDRMVDILSDGVVLADFTSSLDPTRLPPTSILRASGRNALSAPAHASGAGPAEAARNIDARQREVQYRENTRRVVAALKRLFEVVREREGESGSQATGTVENFVGDVASVSPLKDLRPALRLAELVVAASVYGPAKELYKNLFWELPTDGARRAFHKSMTGVAQALFLPTPNALYADGPGGSPVVSPMGVEEKKGGDVVALSRVHAQEASVPPLVGRSVKPDVLDEGMGGRKFSMVTEDGNASREANSPAREDPPNIGSAIQFSPDKDLSIGTPARESAVEQAEQRVMQGETDFDNQSKSASEEFFTPRERSPSPEGSRRNTSLMSGSAHASSSVRRVEESRVGQMIVSGARARLDSRRAQPTPEDVDETVRQSVSTSIAQQISQAPDIEESDSLGAFEGELSSMQHSREVLDSEISGRHDEPPSYGEETSRPVDFTDPTFMVSPSGSDAPSPSNQWQISRQKAISAEIMSPQQLFSPPRMPRRLSRTATATQMTPPPGPPLFGRDSPQMSVSSAGGDEVPETESLQASSRNPKVSFAPNIISPGGHERPLGRPLRVAGGEVSAGGVGHGTGRDQAFSLPPCAAVSEAKNVARASASHSETSQLKEQQEVRSTTTSAPVEPSSFADDVLEATSRQDALLEEETYAREAGISFPGNPEDEGDEGDIFAEIEALKAANPDITFLSQAERPVSPPPGYPGRPMVPQPKDRQVPPTPPSPPTLATLVESFTERRQSARPVEARPVSTMAPSPGLFKKLIAVWQSAEDGEVKFANHQRDESGKGQTAQPTTGEASQSLSTHESTLPSGDTDVNLGKAAPVLTGSPKTRRPRAIRLAPGSPSREDLAKLGEGQLAGSDIDDRESVASKGSAASFSDAFSSDRDRNWLYGGEAMADRYDWEEAMKGDEDAGIPVASRGQEMRGAAPAVEPRPAAPKERAPGHEKPPLPPSPRPGTRKVKSHSTSTVERGVAMEGEHIKVDRRRMDWLTRELLAARDVIARQELQMTFAETQRMEQEEILLLDKQNAESVVGAMKEILSDREKELNEARERLSVAIQGVSHDRSSQGSKTSMSGQGEDLSKMISESNTKLRSRMDESDAKSREVADEMRKETQGLWAEVKRAMIEKMAEMNEKRDAELSILKAELDHRQKLIDDLQKSSQDLRSKNQGYQSEVHAIRLEKEKSIHKYQLEMAHVSAQVELVNEFSKKLHDNFRETENLRQQVLQYQDKLSHITSTSGISQRQIKELREAVTRANDECARWRREAELEKRKGMEAERRAEELEELRHKDAQASASRFPDRADSGSFRSHEPVRSPGGSRSGAGTRYAGSRSRGVAGSGTPAQKAWLVIKDKIGGIVTGKESSSSRRRGPGYSARRDLSRGSGSRSSGNSRSRYSPRDDDMLRRSRTGSARSRSSNGSGSSVRSGTPRSGGSGRRGSPVPNVHQYMHESPGMRGEVSRIRAVDF